MPRQRRLVFVTCPPGARVVVADGGHPPVNIGAPTVRCADRIDVRDWERLRWSWPSGRWSRSGR
jgi:hypothetical protein